ncbi:hypothetical protein H2203_007589 [Taxawa tesnikishii (nom. ined.)]|nr:hypothetical protein H2203_007589 [Dothideales sp. JES 119]
MSALDDKCFPLRIHTYTSNITSGFPYQQSLFEVGILPEEWYAMSNAIVRAAQPTLSDHAITWAAASGVAMTSLIGFAIYAGRKMNMQRQQKRLRENLSNFSATGLGETLRSWNEQCLRRHGLFMYLELGNGDVDHPRILIRKAFPKKSQEERMKQKCCLVIVPLSKGGKAPEGLPDGSESVVMPVTPTEMPAERDPIELNSQQVVSLENLMITEQKPALVSDSKADADDDIKKTPMAEERPVPETIVAELPA